MKNWPAWFATGVFSLLIFVALATAQTRIGASWTGVLRNAAGNPAYGANIRLHSPKSNATLSSTTTSVGVFSFQSLSPGEYELSVHIGDKDWTLPGLLTVDPASPSDLDLQLSAEGH